MTIQPGSIYETKKTKRKGKFMRIEGNYWSKYKVREEYDHEYKNIYVGIIEKVENVRKTEGYYIYVKKMSESKRWDGSDRVKKIINMEKERMKAGHI